MTSHGSRDFDSAKRSRSTQIANLTKLYKKLEENMSSYENYENVKQLNNRWCKNFETLKCVHQECVSLCTDSVMCEDVSKSFESSPKNFDEFQERLSQWLVANEKASDDEDMISSVSRASTTASSRSNLRSARAKRLLTEHKLRTLREKHRLEQERRVLQHKRQLLEHEREVEEARIEEAIWEEEKEEGITTIGDVMVRSSGADQMSGDLTVRSGEAHRMSGDLTVRSGGAHRMSGDLTVRSGGADQKFGDFTVRSGGADRTSGDLTVRTGGSDRLSGDLSMRYSRVDWKSGDVTVRSREDVPEVVHHGQNILPDDVCNIREGSDISRPYSVTHNVTSGNRDLPMAAAEARSGKTEHMLYIDSAFHRIASTLQEGFNLPKPEILTFSGKAIDYCDVMLLIGTDAPEANIPLDVRTGEQNQPYAVRSRLGWVVRGPVQSTTDTHIGNDVNINFSQSHGVLLQQQLERPDFVNSLVGVLCRFRQERVAIVADIEAMFHQVRVCEHDCQALRFLWWPGGDISATPKTFSMQQRSRDDADNSTLPFDQWSRWGATGVGGYS
ncbi:uncharacterized protein LOC127870186 [Dreissena polymorpha]|uniref:uncharacterized protein LOC127870186 n=1 Tax=Dreissena polymorpha TaxID=45954 RepID=UPI0022655BAF|nr:uncharacterized protein LOC127870186 [Dreissena polymorpha]